MINFKSSLSLFVFFFSVSAFYAEHYNKQMSINAHIWTKSKFLGLSIGVENVGQGKLTNHKTPNYLNFIGTKKELYNIMG